MEYLQSGGGIGLLVTDPSETSVQCLGGMGIAKNLTISEKFMSSDADTTNFNGIFGAPWMWTGGSPAYFYGRAPSNFDTVMVPEACVAGVNVRTGGLASTSKTDTLPSQSDWYTHISTTYGLGQADAYSFTFETFVAIQNGAGQSSAFNVIAKGTNTTLIVQNWGQTAAKNNFRLDQTTSPPANPVAAARIKINIRKNAGSTTPQVYYIANACRYNL